MKRFLLLTCVAVIAISGCSKSSSGTTTTTPPTVATTELSGTWATTGTGTCAAGSCGTSALSVNATYTVKLVSSTCSVTTPLSTTPFTVTGPTCFIANNNSQAGSIFGTNIPTTSKNLGQGVLIGAPTDPVPDNSTVNLMFVSGSHGGSYVEFTGTGTIVGGKITGTGACNTTASPSCKGMTATFTATKM